MFESLAADIKSVFLNPNLKGFAYLAFLVLGVVLINYIAGFSFYYNLDNQIEALEKLQTLNEKGIGSSEDLRSIYSGVVGKIQRRQSPYYGLSVPAEGITRYQIPAPFVPLVKFLSATLYYLLWLVYALYLAIRGNPDGSGMLVGIIAFIIVFGIVAVIIPTIISVWTNVVIFGLLQIASVVALSRYGNSIRMQQEIIRRLQPEVGRMKGV